ncbi:hypothetical protein EK21DRAFT_116266 [Setomelanomma holmii]|uniref:Uncharacterized protein n=1 Tax=Setomelanomma holmii TaxID=210430 RepID=A0A9P4H1Q2_9PLEO|nr:hypothetical protein EK21DRAFT_116266 [Setomelanomma holmii]
MPISSSIEIASPPQLVREKFLDFPSLPTYHSGTFFKSITTQTTLEPRSKLTVVFASMGTMQPKFHTNELHLFAWHGNLPLIFGGHHKSKFEDSKTTPGGTTFTQEEIFHGMFAFLMGEGWIARKVGFREKTLRGWEGCNRDLKRWCEGSLEK